MFSLQLGPIDDFLLLIVESVKEYLEVVWVEIPLSQNSRIGKIPPLKEEDYLIVNLFREIEFYYLSRLINFKFNVGELNWRKYMKYFFISYHCI